MLITEINIPEDISSHVELDTISMKKIGKTVLLAGKNGSGKTRILNLVRQEANNLSRNVQDKEQANLQVKSLKEQIANLPQSKIHQEQQIKQLTQNINNWEEQIESQPQQELQHKENIEQYEKNIVTLSSRQGDKTVELKIEQEKKAITKQQQQIENLPRQKQQLENNIESYSQNIVNLEKAINGLPEQKIKLQNEIETQNKLIDTALPIVCEGNKLTVVDFVPNKIELEGWSNFSKQEWENRATTAKTLGIKTIHQATIPLIHQVSERFFNATHQHLQSTEIEINNATKDYERLKNIIKSFLGADISWNLDAHSTIFGKPIAQANLSAGQRILLQLSVAIFSQGGSLTDHVIFMDEPENHLHPSAVIDLIDTLRTHSPNGQIWIATHSIPLLSHFEASALWFVEKGTIKPSGKKPEVVLRSLLGDEENVQKLKDFISLPDELARTRFAFECLCPPLVVETNSNDPQSIQLNQQLQLIWDDKESLKLLDFGAGKGRMIANLVDYDNVTSTTLDYHAYDLFDDDKDYCLSNISLSYDDPENRYHNSIELLRTKLDDNYFDVIVLSNVLHEIPHPEWCNIFKDMSKLLKEGGYLLLIEDCLIPTGELPHRNGFVVFNTLHLKKLFEIPATEENFIQHDARFDSVEQRGRLMAHLIPTQYLTNSSPETIKIALTELKNSAQTEVKKVRAKEATYSNGLAHSFWIQQLANTVLCLSEYGEG